MKALTVLVFLAGCAGLEYHEPRHAYRNHVAEDAASNQQRTQQILMGNRPTVCTTSPDYLGGYRTVCQ